MPTYSYACKDCAHAFDIQQAFTDDSLTVCPECQGTLRKIFSPVGVVFKGSGFYKTDSASSGRRSSSGAAKDTSASSSSGSSGSSESGSGSSSQSSSGNSSGSSGSGSSSSTSSSTSSSPSS